MINNQLTQLLAVTNVQPKPQKFSIKTIPGQGQQNVEHTPTLDEKLVEGAQSELVKAVSKEAVASTGLVPDKAKKEGALVENAPVKKNPDFLTKPYTPVPIEFSSTNDGLDNYAENGVPFLKNDLPYIPPEPEPETIPQHNYTGSVYNPLTGGFSGISSLNKAKEKIATVRKIQESKDLLENYHIGSDGSLYTKNSRGDTVKTTFGGRHPTFTALKEAKQYLDSLPPEELEASSPQPVTNDPQKDLTELTKAAQMTDAEREMRQANNDILKQSQLREALYGAGSAGERSDLERESAREAMRLYNLKNSGSNTVANNPYQNLNGNSSGTTGEDSLDDPPREQTLKQIRDVLQANKIPSSELMDKTHEDVVAVRNDLVGKVTAAGAALGSADDIAYAVDHQNLSEDAVAKDILAGFNKTGDIPGLDQVGIAHIIKEARKSYPDLKPATIGMVLKGYLQTNAQAKWYRYGDADISEQLSYRDNEFMNALRTLSNSKTQGYKHIETLFYDARKDLKELLSLEKQYELYSNAYNEVLSDQQFFKDSSKYAGIKKYIEANNQKAYDNASVFFSKAASIFKKLEAKNKQIQK